MGELIDYATTPRRPPRWARVVGRLTIFVLIALAAWFTIHLYLFLKYDD